MTRFGVIAPGSDGTARAVAQLGDAERIRAARVHPIALLAALRTSRADAGAPSHRQKGDEMHRHLYVVRRPARHVPVRPAKVVQLEARRQARLDLARDPRQPTRPAA